MCDVVIRPCGSYQDAKEALLQVLSPLGGLDWVQPGMKIAIKANLDVVLVFSGSSCSSLGCLCELLSSLFCQCKYDIECHYMQKYRP